MSPRTSARLHLNSTQLKLRGPSSNMSLPCSTPPILARRSPGPRYSFWPTRADSAHVGSSQPIAPVSPLLPRSSAQLKRRSVRELSQVMKGNRADRRHGCRGPAPRPRPISVTAYCKLQYERQGWIERDWGCVYGYACMGNACGAIGDPRSRFPY